MPERTGITQVTQLGVETTAGTAVAANKLLPSLSIEPTIKPNVKGYRGSGFKVPTVHAAGKEWSEWKVSGAPTFDELIYMFASMFTFGSPSTSDTSAKTWGAAPSATAVDAGKSFTIEHGSSVRAEKSAYGILTELGLEWTPAEFSLSGTMLAKALQDGITLTSSPTALAQIPILPGSCDVYLDSSGAALGTTKLARCKKWSLKLGGRFNPFMVADSTNNSFAGLAEGPIDAKLELTLEADAEGMALLDRLRDSAHVFPRIKFTDSRLAGAATVPYSMRIDCAGTVTDAGSFAVDEGLWVVPWSLDHAYDGTWGKWLDLQVVNKLASL